MHELRSHHIPVAMASDNIRDQFYAYGDLDMLEVFTQVSVLSGTSLMPQASCLHLPPRLAPQPCTQAGS